MKKFLFTLAALMMAGSAFAESYFEAPDMELTEAQLGTTINLDVYANFGEMVSAYDVWFGGYNGDEFVEGLMPEGLDVTAISQLSSAKISYIGYVYNEDDDAYTYQQTTCTPSFSTAGNYHGIAITSALDHEYALIDGEYVDCIAIKWQPGYFKMLRLKVAVAADFKGGDIVIKTLPSSGRDPRGAVAQAIEHFETVHLSAPAAQGPEDFVGTANVEFVGSVAQLSYTSNDPNATVVVTCDDKEVEVNWVENNGTYTATYNVEESTELGNHSSVVTLTVTPDGENFVGEAASDNATYSYTVTEDFDAVVEVVFNGNVATLTYVANDDAAVPTVYVNGVETAVEWNNGEATYTVTESTVPGTYNVTVELSVAPGNQFIIGDPISDSATYTYTVLETTATPVITEVERHHNWVKFHVEGNGTLTVLVDGTPVQLDAEGNYIVYASTENDVTYVVVATAKEDGKYESAPAQMNITIAKWDGVDELVNGKTVAGVRYFNMAGQEMQEANGMTIVVTTYTDGTTSAVKVMK